MTEYSGFKAWLDEHRAQIGDSCTKLVALDESLTSWEVEEMALDEAGQLIVDIDTRDFVMRTRVITTTPGRPAWLVDLDREVEL